MPTEFDQLCVVFLTTKKGAAVKSYVDDTIQDSHMAYLADLHEKHHLLAAGPLLDSHFRGMLLFDTDVETAWNLMLTDPGVLAGWFDVTVIPWIVPSGAMHFASTVFPRSMNEVSDS